MKNLIQKVIDIGNINALRDALDMCKALERQGMAEVGEQKIFNEENFNLSHSYNKVIRSIAQSLVPSIGGEALSVYKQSLLFDAPYDFDAYCLYIEWNREHRKQFYAPRRKQLLPVVKALQDLEDDKIDILGISMPPGTGKSTLALFFLSWESGKHPELANLSGSHNNAFLNGIYGEMLRILDPKGEYLWHDVFPTLQVISTNAKDLMIDIADDKNKGKRFATLEFTSIGSQNAGKVRAQNLLYCDDLVDGIETAMSRERLDKLWQMYHTDLRQRKQGNCKELHIATRWSLVDILGRLAEEYEDNDRVKFISIPALDENDESNFDYPYKIGFSTQMYHEQRDIMDEASWDALYMGRPIERQGILYEPSELRRYFELPEPEPDAILCVCDTKEQGTDYAVVPLVYQYGDDYYVEKIICDNGKVEILEERIARYFVDNNVHMARFESNRGGTLFAQKVQELVKQYGGKTSISSRWTQSNKETRIIVSSGYVKEHFLFKDEIYYKKDKEYEKAMRQLTSYTMSSKNKNDDVADVFSLMVDFIRTMRGNKITIMKRPF